MEKNELISSSAHQYLVDRWGLGYFGINEKGHLSVFPKRHQSGPVIDIFEVVQEMKRKNVGFPAVIRFHDILRSQITSINKLFDYVITEANFQGQYYGVYPIKVNQMREVVEEVADVGSQFNYGFEAGSKAELMAILSQEITDESIMVCNGYKDDEYMKLALLGRQMGRQIFVVIEKFSELKLLLKAAKETGVEPLIGVRAKLHCKSAGKWAASSGESAKFGLNSYELIKTIETLKEQDLLHCLKLFHFHIGSQIPDIMTFKNAMNEGARLFCELTKLGAPLEYFDVGGGVGVDYDGSQSNADSSINYGFKDYVGDVVYLLKEVCDQEKVPHPHIVSESGRAMTAHHSCVITNVFGSINPLEETNLEATGEEHSLVRRMQELTAENFENYQEIYYDALQLKREAHSAFNLGVISLKEKTLTESYYWKIAQRVYHVAQKQEMPPEDILDLKKKLAQQYLCNLSVFQSAPDSWAINQVLPIMPIHRLDEEATVDATLCDITCDSDGKVNRFLSPEGHENTLKVHEINGEDYFLGFFLTGAYQDVMGDNHNMFGRLNEVHVFCDDDDPTDFYIEEFIPGNSCSDVLKTMQYTPETMASQVKAKIDSEVKKGKLRPRRGVELTDFYENALKSYTYLK
jgi:arginine decarboxylase